MLNLRVFCLGQKKSLRYIASREKKHQTWKLKAWFQSSKLVEFKKGKLGLFVCYAILPHLESLVKRDNKMHF